MNGAGLLLAKQQSEQKVPAEEVEATIESYKREIDFSLLRANLKLTPSKRLQKLEELLLFTEELRNAPRLGLSVPSHRISAET